VSDVKCDRASVARQGEEHIGVTSVAALNSSAVAAALLCALASTLTLTKGILTCSSSAERKKKRAKASRAVLSFDADDGDDIAPAPIKRSKTASSSAAGKTSLKNPEVDTSFLPDRAREEEEAKLREELRKEFLRKQEELKREEIEITYSYWDGSGHRKSVKVGVERGGRRGGLGDRRHVGVMGRWPARACASMSGPLVLPKLLQPQHDAHTPLSRCSRATLSRRSSKSAGCSSPSCAQPASTI
jgi:hypothetical protein